MNNFASRSWDKLVLAAAAAALLICAGATHAQTAGYIRVVTAQGALDGGSKDPAHLNWITVSSVVAGDLNGDGMADREASAPSVSELTATREIGSQSSGAGAGKVTNSNSTNAAASHSVVSPRDAASGMATGKRMHKPFVIMKEVDKASPVLVQACASGQHFSEVDVALASKPGGFYRLSDVVVSSVQKSSGGDRPMESVSFTFQKIEWTR